MHYTNIYLIQCEDEIKIGRSKEVKKRLSTLQTGNTKDMIIKYVIEEVPECFEKHLHGICRMYHIKGEWFKKGAIDHLMSITPLKNMIKKY